MEIQKKTFSLPVTANENNRLLPANILDHKIYALESMKNPKFCKFAFLFYHKLCAKSQYDD